MAQESQTGQKTENTDAQVKEQSGEPAKKKLLR